VWGDSAADPMMVGEDAAIDVNEDPDRWLWFVRTGSRDGWRDMAAFAKRQRDGAFRERLERAIEGKGPFRRFRDVIHEGASPSTGARSRLTARSAVPASSSPTRAFA
jgi:hypothetical protein